MAHKPPETRKEWDELAQYRVRRVLRRRVAATVRQLEVKICESGPAHIRPQPHILSHALSTLLANGILKTHKAPKQHGEHEETVFYAYGKLPEAYVKERIAMLLVHYRTHRMCADRNEWCSNVLEEIVRASFDADRTYTYLGQPPVNRPLDAAYLHEPSGVTLGIEVKNVREWIYPASERVWPMLSKCVELDAVPVLITREVSYLAKQMFRAIGVLRLEFHRQVFSPLVAHLLPPIQDVNLLGYKDVVALPSEPHPTVIGFAASTVPKFLLQYRELWMAHRDLVAEYADKKGLATSKLRAQQRDQLIAAFLKELKIHQ